MGLLPHGVWVGAMIAMVVAPVSGDGWRQVQSEEKPTVGGPAMAYDTARHVAVLYTTAFGENESETWELEGGQWHRSATGGPPKLTFTELAFDSNRTRTVLFGGNNGFGQVSPTWEWNGDDWEYVGEGAGPRDWHAMSYDRDRGVCVVFGGVWDELELIYDDTWEYDGLQWIQRAIDGPPARALHAMTYDSLRHVTLMYGGDYPLFDLWAWDGQTWSLLDDGKGLPGTPNYRAGHAMDFDSNRGRAMLFGGQTQGGLSNDLWEWDGADWSLSPTPDAPAKRAFHAMAYDPDLHRLVLFGGLDADGKWLSDTWEYILPPPPCYPDLDGSGSLDLFDFLAFINLFNAADCDASGTLDFFDFLCFNNAFNAGC